MENLTIANKSCTVSATIKEGRVSFKIEHKGRFQTFGLETAKQWKKATPKRLHKAAVEYLTQAPEKRIANLLSYKTVNAVAKFRTKIA